MLSPGIGIVLSESPPDHSEVGEVTLILQDTGTEAQRGEATGPKAIVGWSYP